MALKLGDKIASLGGGAEWVRLESYEHLKRLTDKEYNKQHLIFSDDGDTVYNLHQDGWRLTDEDLKGWDYQNNSDGGLYRYWLISIPNPKWYTK